MNSGTDNYRPDTYTTSGTVASNEGYYEPKPQQPVELPYWPRPPKVVRLPSRGHAWRWHPDYGRR
jgi:hypothetical protein